MPRKSSQKREDYDEVDTAFKSFKSDHKEISPGFGGWLRFIITAIIIQAIPLYYLEFIDEVYILNYPILEGICLGVGAIALSYAYVLAFKSYAYRKLKNQDVLSEKELKGETMQYSLFKCTATYLIAFIVSEWLIKFNGINTKVGTVFGVTAVVTVFTAAL
ncbi:hypothetical protein BLNAU_18770 [Blattamonas nauphoetae]|uniref:Translocon-associated protein subunit gamma n=1 Tax=Blattamonas nauphoetae TaxID=2049346 RepID=A0ABQ9X3P9_9EUKA|nr:hypothetical protein BLNAU_18770 [Blattamonas nauphoetae]